MPTNQSRTRLNSVIKFTGVQSIIEYAHADYDKSRISIRSQQSNTEADKKKRGGVKGHQGRLRIPRKADFIIELVPRITCPKHEDTLLDKFDKIADKFIINLRFTKAGIKKIVTKYVGVRGYCKKCRKYYPPPGVDEIGTRLFGHNFQAWV